MHPLILVAACSDGCLESIGCRGVDGGKEGGELGRGPAETMLADRFTKQRTKGPHSACLPHPILQRGFLQSWMSPTKGCSFPTEQRPECTHFIALAGANRATKNNVSSILLGVLLGARGHPIGSALRSLQLSFSGAILEESCHV